jgi:hypothetical protein
MSRFDAFLHRTDERLALPRATRSLILVEIAADLDDLFQHYLSQGLSEEDAAARAEAKVDMSDVALAELVRIHSDARGWSDRLIRNARPFWERIAMALIVIFFVISAALLAVETDVRLLDHLTRFIWPIAAVFVVLVIFLIVQLVRSSSDTANPRQLRESLATPLFLGAASLVVGFAGTGITMYRALMRMAAVPEHAAPIFARAFLGTTATFAVALLVTLFAGIVWFVLAGRAARVEDDAAKSLLGVS